MSDDPTRFTRPGPPLTEEETEDLLRVLSNPDFDPETWLEVQKAYLKEGISVEHELRLVAQIEAHKMKHGLD